jgi:hypothetical protein
MTSGSGTVWTLGNASPWGSFPLPMHAKTAVFVDGMYLEVAPIRMMERLTDAARQVEVGGGDQNTVRSCLDVHDSMQRVFRLFSCLLIASQVEDFLLVISEEAAAQGQESGGVVITDPLAGWAHRFVSRRGLGHPSPPLVMEYGMTVGTTRGVGEPLLRGRGLMYTFLGAPVSPTLLRHRLFGLVFHQHTFQWMWRTAASLPPDDGPSLVADAP